MAECAALRGRWVVLGAAAIALAAHSLAYNFVTDDAYISFVFSRNFAEHGQLVFNLGQPVEGYTNFLWTAWMAVVHLSGVSDAKAALLVMLSGAAILVANLFVVRAIAETVAPGRRGVNAFSRTLDM